MKDTEWRNLIHKTAGKMIFIADSLGVLNVKYDNDITIEEGIEKIEEFLKTALDVEISFDNFEV